MTPQEQAEFHTNANEALIAICSRQIQALEEIRRASVWSTFKIRRIAREALDDRAIQLRKPPSGASYGE